MPHLTDSLPETMTVSPAFVICMCHCLCSHNAIVHLSNKRNHLQDLNVLNRRAHHSAAHCLFSNACTGCLNVHLLRVRFSISSHASLSSSQKCLLLSPLDSLLFSILGRWLHNAAVLLSHVRCLQCCGLCSMAMISPTQRCACGLLAPRPFRPQRQPVTSSQPLSKTRCRAPCGTRRGTRQPYCLCPTYPVPRASYPASTTSSAPSPASTR
jgi:hypothetical protein